MLVQGTEAAVGSVTCSGEGDQQLFTALKGYSYGRSLTSS